jgi:hypothetical protein
LGRFQLKTLDPLVRKASGRIDAALGASDISDRTDGLLAARMENGTAFKQAARRQIFKMAGALGLLAVGAWTAALGIMTATSIFATLAGTTGYSIPVAIAGAAAFAAGAACLGVAASNYNRVRNSRKSLNGKIDQAVSTLVKTTS